MTSWQSIGNVAHFVNIALVFCYATSIFAYGEQLHEKGVIDSRWFEEGYCRAEQTSAGQMHFDAAFAMILTFVPIAFLLYLHSKNGSIKEDSKSRVNEDTDDLYANVKYGMVGVVSHAIGHFLIWEGIRAGVFPDGEMRGIDDLKQSSALLVVRKILPGYIFFFAPLTKSYMRHTSVPLVLLFAKFGQFASLFAPMKYSFVFGMSFFFVAFSLDKLLFVPASKKNFSYAIYPMVTVIPSILLAWFEATLCSSSMLLTNFGHSFFDSWLGVSYILYAVIAHLHLSRISKVSVKME